MKKRLLFVDDDAGILQGIKRSLRSKRHDWDIDFAASGELALQALRDQHYDLLISDMRMPGMNGAELLDLVAEQYPQTIRFILSGYADEALSLKSAITAHQFLAKPIDSDVLIKTIERAFALSDSLGDDRLHGFVNSLRTLPSLPQAYQDLLGALSAPDSSMAEIGKIISLDPAMSAKILQMVNSAFFGLGREISDVQEAVRMIGMDAINALVLNIGIFSQFDDSQLKHFDFAKLQAHYLEVAILSEKIARSMGQNKSFIDDCFLAGMVHDVGILIMYQNGPEQIRQVNELMKAQNIDRTSAENSIFGFNHGLVGAYLLGIWGLRHDVVEAVAFHHSPNDIPNNQFSVATVLHVASALIDDNHSCDEDGPDSCTGVGVDYLKSLGLLDRMQDWKALLEDINEQ